MDLYSKLVKQAQSLKKQGVKESAAKKLMENAAGHGSISTMLALAAVYGRNKS